MDLMTPDQLNALHAGFPGVDFTAANHRNEPPTMEEFRIRALIMEAYWLLFVDDPVQCPEPPRMVWMGMLGATHNDMIAAGMVAVWP